MSRWVFVATGVLLLAGVATVAVARRLGGSGSRASVLVTVVAGWLTAWVLWGFVGGLAVRYGALATYDPTLFAALALGGGFWQYRTQVRAGRERGFAVLVGGQIAWALVVLVQNGILDR